MILEYLLKTYNSSLLKIDQFTNRKNWKVELTLIIPFIVLFFSFPSYEYMFDESMTNWKHLLEQAAHPFSQNNYAPDTHQSKMTFRLFGPVLIRVFHLNIISITILQMLAGTLMVYFFIKATLSITNNKVATVLLTFAFACTSICTSPFTDILGYLDGFALFFLIIPFAFTNPIFIFLGVFLAGWVDERGLIATSLIFIWTAFIQKDKKIINTIAVVLAWISYFFIRIMIAWKYNLTTHTGGINFSNQLNNAPLGIWTGLEGFWVIILLSVLILCKTRKKIIAAFFASSIGIIMLVALSVVDITRSMIYLFPAIFISLIVIKNVENEKNLIHIATVVLLLCVLFPQLSAGGYNFVNWQYPFPIQMLRYLTQ